MQARYSCRVPAKAGPLLLLQHLALASDATEGQLLQAGPAAGFLAKATAAAA